MANRAPETTMRQLEALAFAGMGKPIEPCEVLREIEKSDLPVLAEAQRSNAWSTGNSTQSLQTLRTGHHQLAQLLAAGVSVADASLMTGRAPSSISALNADPAFKELLAYYREQQEKRDLNMYDRLVTLGATAAEVLQERIEEEPDRFTNNELRQLMESTMDRSAAPAKGDPRNNAGSGKPGGVNLNISFVQAGPSGPIVEVDAEEIKQIGEKQSDHKGN